MFSENSNTSANNSSILNEQFSKGFLLEKEFWIYLIEERILNHLQEAVCQYEKTVTESLNKKFLPSFRFHFKLDLMKIQEKSEELYDLFLKAPDVGFAKAKNVIFFALKQMIPALDLCDLQIIPLVVNLPITNEISDLFIYPSRGLESVQGILMAKTTVYKYVRNSFLICENCNIIKKYKNRGNFGNICPECHSYLKEDISSSYTGEEIICQFISSKALQNNGIFQALSVRLKDEVCNLINLQIGEEYKVTGRINDKYFDVLNIQSKKNNDEFLYPILNSAKLPKSISDLYFHVRNISLNSAWSFVYALSSSLGSTYIPASSFLHLKIGLLLSLSTQKSESPVPLFAIGSDSLNAQRLLHSAGKLAERYVRLSIAHSHLGGIERRNDKSDALWQEAGQFILATKGVCNLGDWSKYKKEQISYICQTIESGQIYLNKLSPGKKNLMNFVPLKSTIWTYWCNFTSSMLHKIQLKTLIDVFGMPFLVDEQDEMEIRKICQKQLENAMRKTSTSTKLNVISPNELKNFLEIINSRDVILSENASQLITSYFVASRRERPHCLPMGAVKTITSLAEAHARLALRDEVMYDDVVPVIYLYEETMSKLFGPVMSPYQKLTWNQQEPIYIFMGKEMQRFSIWLKNYIAN